MLDLGLLPAFVSAFGIVKDSGSYLVEAVPWLRVGDWLSKGHNHSPFLSQRSLRVVEAPVHAHVVGHLIGLEVLGVVVPENLILKRYMLIHEVLLCRGDIQWILWIDLGMSDTAGALFVFLSFNFHQILLLIEIELHLV